MTKVLLTGFEPFGKASLNPSGEIVKQISGENIVTAILPVAYEQSAEALLALIEQHKPDVVISLGQAEGRTQITPERIAINLDDARLADNEGVIRNDVPILVGGPVAYESTLPIKAIVHALRSEGIPAEVSNSAGTYVCNHVFYGLMHLCRHIPGMRAGFVHIPYLPEQALKLPGAPSMAMEIMVRALTLIVRTALEAKTDAHLSGGTEC